MYCTGTAVLSWKSDACLSEPALVSFNREEGAAVASHFRTLGDAWSLVFLFSQQQQLLLLLLNACMPVHGHWFFYFRSSSICCCCCCGNWSVPNVVTDRYLSTCGVWYLNLGVHSFTGTCSDRYRIDRIFGNILSYIIYLIRRHRGVDQYIWDFHSGPVEKMRTSPRFRLPKFRFARSVLVPW
jgi:hypothetical protein